MDPLFPKLYSKQPSLCGVGELGYRLVHFRKFPECCYTGNFLLLRVKNYAWAEVDLLRSREEIKI